MESNEQLNESNEKQREKEEIDNQIDSMKYTIDEDVNFQIKLMADEALERLNMFYSNPLYLDSIAEESEKERLVGDFGTINQAVSLLAKDTGALSPERRIELTNVFNNYLQLCQYYVKNKRVGVNLESVLKASEEQSDVLKKYSDIKKGVEGEFQANTQQGRLEEADRYLKEQSNNVLMGIITTLNKSPELENVVNVWLGDQIVKAPSKSSYLEEVYSIYRDNSGQVDIMERGFRKLFSINERNPILARLSAALALFFDGCIVYLMFYRGRKAYSSCLSDYRRMQGIFFINPELNKRQQQYTHGQKLATALGVITGVVTFVVYKQRQSPDGSGAAMDAFSLAAFCLAGAAFCVILYKIYRRVVCRENDWRDENIYQMWKSIWQKNGFDEEGIKSKLKSLSLNKEKTILEFDSENIKDMLGLLKREKTSREFLQYFYPEALEVLSQAQIEQFKIVVCHINQRDKLPLQTWEEIKELPCVEKKVVADNNLSLEFSVLMSRHIISPAIKRKDGKEILYYVLPDKFWGLLYDIVLLKISGNSVISYNLEEDLLGYSEGEDEEA